MIKKLEAQKYGLLNTDETEYWLTWNID